MLLSIYFITKNKQDALLSVCGRKYLQRCNLHHISVFSLSLLTHATLDPEAEENFSQLGLLQSRMVRSGCSLQNLVLTSLSSLFRTLQQQYCAAVTMTSQQHCSYHRGKLWLLQSPIVHCRLCDNVVPSTRNSNTLQKNV